MNTGFRFRAVVVFAAVMAVGYVLLVLLSRGVRSGSDVRPAVKDTTTAPSGGAITEDVRATEKRPPVVTPPEPSARAEQADMAELRQPLINALMLLDPAEQWRALKQLGIEPSSDDFRRGLDNLGEDHEELVKIWHLVSQWAASDAKAASAWVMEPGGGHKKTIAVQALVKVWKKEDPEGVRQWVASIPQGALRDMAAGQLIRYLAPTDPIGAAGVIQWIKEDSERLYAFAKVASHWADKDIEAARHWLQTLPEGRERDIATKMMAEVISSKAPEEAAALLAQIKGANPLQVVSLFSAEYLAGALPLAIGNVLSPREPSARPEQAEAADLRQALIDALMLADPIEKWRVLKRFGIEPENDDFRCALGNLGDRGPDMVKINYLVSQWVAFEPQAAAAWLMELGTGEKQSHALLGLAESWGKVDIAGARQWAASLPVGDLRDRAVGELVKIYMPADPIAAAEVARWIGATGVLLDVAEDVVNDCADEDPKAVWRWLQEVLPKGPKREAGIALMVRAISSEAPAEAAALLAQSKNKDRDFLLEVAPEIMSHWIRQDQAAAVQWMLGLPAGLVRDGAVYTYVTQFPDAQRAIAIWWAQSIKDEEVRAAALSDVVYKWASHDPAAASEWLNQMPKGLVRDEVVVQFVVAVLKTYPADALPWALSIQDASRRKSITKALLRSWLRADRDTAEAWLNSAPLSEAIKQEVLREVGK